MGTSILTNLNSLQAQASFRLNSDFQADDPAADVGLPHHTRR